MIPETAPASLAHDPALRARAASTLRLLAADAVQAANSGHPGAPMGQADLALVLWDEFLRFDPHDPAWPARDRFVLSCGHASALLYSLLHLFGFDVTLDDLKNFRQWDSRTPGHPEVGLTPGVEITTGPLGQGVAHAVGMALAAKLIQARVATPDFDPMPQRVFALCSDGDLMEGLSAEAASLAGHWRLDNLVWLYDDNKITIDGSTDLAFSEDVAARFAACGWRVLRADGHAADSVRVALKGTLGGAEPRPTLIICRTHIGFGSPNKVDTPGVHGSPLGDAELGLVRAGLGWPTERFHVPAEVQSWAAARAAAKTAERAAWQARLDAWRAAHPERAAHLDALWSGAVPADLLERLLAATPAQGATRKTSQAALTAALACVPGLVGGSADLTGSNGTALTGGQLVRATEGGHTLDFSGRQIPFGIREHAMGAIINGICLHGGLKPFGATFLVFSDYQRPSLRLAALSHLPALYLYSHDSIFLGEDGPTHQAVEHHWALRAIPGLAYWRPADGVETAVAWAFALEQTHRPTAFALTRQDLPAVPHPAGFDPAIIRRGGYAVSDSPDPEVILVGTGSEVQLCVGAAAQLTAEGRRVRVVSMPCVDVFLEQDAAYQDALIPPRHPAVVTVEAGITGPWRQIAGRRGLCVGLDRFGASAPAEVLAERFGFTVEALTARVCAFLEA